MKSSSAWNANQVNVDESLNWKGKSYRMKCSGGADSVHVGAGLYGFPFSCLMKLQPPEKVGGTAASEETEFCSTASCFHQVE